MKNKLVMDKFSKWSKIIKKKFMNLIIVMNVCVTTSRPRLKLLSKNKFQKKKKFTIMIKKYMKKTSKFKNFKNLTSSCRYNRPIYKGSTSKKPKNWNKQKKTTNVSNNYTRRVKNLFWIYKMKIWILNINIKQK